jgi:hypothetical protein
VGENLTWDQRKRHRQRGTRGWRAGVIAAPYVTCVGNVKVTVWGTIDIQRRLPLHRERWVPPARMPTEYRSAAHCPGSIHSRSLSLPARADRWVRRSAVVGRGHSGNTRMARLCHSFYTKLKKLLAEQVEALHTENEVLFILIQSG